jgi:hypothetical protein
MQLLHVGDGFPGRAQVRLRDDLHQWRSGPVQVDPGHGAKALVQALAGILLQVRPGNPDALARPVVQFDVEMPLRDDRQLVLRDLVTLGKVRVEVVLAGEHRARRDARVDRQPEHHGLGHDRAVQHRKHARQAQVHRAGLAVGFRTVGGGGTREDFRDGIELGMHLQPDHGFPFHAFPPP